MLQLLPLAGLLVALSHGVPMQPIMQPIMQPMQCCETKDVGGVSYTLVGRMDTKSYQCITDCIYVKDDEPGVKFCFASGDLEVECTEDEFQGSEMPPMEGSEKPPMEGSEQPPMEVSEKPPMEGSEKPPMEGSEQPPMEGSEKPPMGETEAPAGNEEPSPEEAQGSSSEETPSAGGSNSSCSYPDTHTMVLYPGPAEQCGYELYFKGLDEAGKELILSRHNELRQKVASGNEAGQPGASNMKKLVWNDELADIAQRWADQCQFGHDDMRDMCDGTFVGQNAYFGQTSDEDYKDDVMASLGDAVDAWYNEVTDPGFSSADINPYNFGDGWGHYTQVVWADTAELGCGMVYYETDDSWFSTLVICNYAVAGNLIGSPMYLAGAGCGNCPAGTACDATYGALCA